MAVPNLMSPHPEHNMKKRTIPFRRYTASKRQQAIADDGTIVKREQEEEDDLINELFGSQDAVATNPTLDLPLRPALAPKSQMPAAGLPGLGLLDRQAPQQDQSEAMPLAPTNAAIPQPLRLGNYTVECPTIDSNDRPTFRALTQTKDGFEEAPTVCFTGQYREAPYLHALSCAHDMITPAMQACGTTCRIAPMADTKPKGELIVCTHKCCVARRAKVKQAVFIPRKRAVQKCQLAKRQVEVHDADMMEVDDRLLVSQDPTIPKNLITSGTDALRYGLKRKTNFQDDGRRRILPVRELGGAPAQASKGPLASAKVGRRKPRREVTPSAEVEEQGEEDEMKSTPVDLLLRTQMLDRSAVAYNGRAEFGHVGQGIEEDDEDAVVPTEGVQPDGSLYLIQRHCECRQPFDGSMEKCQRCKHFYHPECIEKESSKGSTADNFKCAGCNGFLAEARFTCIDCEKLAYCSKCFQDADELHPDHRFAVQRDAPFTCRGCDVAIAEKSGLRKRAWSEGKKTLAERQRQEDAAVSSHNAGIEAKVPEPAPAKQAREIKPQSSTPKRPQTTSKPQAADHKQKKTTTLGAISSRKPVPGSLKAAYMDVEMVDEGVARTRGRLLKKPSRSASRKSKRLVRKGPVDGDVEMGG